MARNRRTKGKTMINSKKCEWNGNEYDSITERDFHMHLLEQPDIVRITLQPMFVVLPVYDVQCHNCRGKGKITNVRTGRLNKCTKCKGTGGRMKRGSYYTPDFVVEYKDGYVEVIDVKGYANELYPIKRRMFEAATGIELVTVERGKMVGEWKRSTVSG